MRALLIAAGLVLLAGSAPAFARPTMAEVHALDRRCEAARVAKLKPIRARKVRQCVAKGRSRSHCVTFYSTYGNNSRMVRGGVIRGLYYNLPQCVAARKALRQVQAARAKP